MENSLDLKETDHFIKMGRGMFKYLREQGGRSCTGARVAPIIRYFVANYALFRDLWTKKCLFGSKTVFLGQEVHYYMVYIAYFTEL